MPRDRLQLARACQVLLNLAGIEDQSLWTGRGPSRRASWLKGYLRRSPTYRRRTDDPGSATGEGRWIGPLAPVAVLSRSERTMFLVAFDFWNGSGGIAFSELLSMAPRLVLAAAGLMEAGCLEAQAQSGAIDAWIARWSPPPVVGGAAPPRR